jgi:hypothetical protein
MKRENRMGTRGLCEVFVAAALAGCGGGSDSEPATQGPNLAAGAAPTTTSAAASPAPASSSASGPTSAPVSAPTYYFSDCQAGAAPSCVQGDDANVGTSPDAPKRTLVGFNVNALPAGARVVFARGGAWTNFHVMLKNLNATPTEPIVFDSYAPAWGGSAAPWLKVSQFIGFEFGHFNDTDNDGGYTVRNLKLDGEGVADWGLWLRTTTRNITLENLDITGFKIGLHTVNEGATGNTAFVLRNSHVHHNSDMGWLGAANDALIEGNTFAYNNFSGSVFSHAIYLGSGSRESRNITLRGNSFLRNSVVNGTCTGGNVTVHGQLDGLLFENNAIVQDASAGGCYGFSISPAYSSAEWFRNTVVRGNTVVNLGNCAICAASAPGIVIENNLVVNTQATYQAAVAIPVFDPEAGDDADRGAIVRNNTAVFTRSSAGSEAIVLRAGAGNGLRMVSNLVYFDAGADATTSCFGHASLANFSALDNNLCHHAGGSGLWSQTYNTLSAARAAGVDTNGQSNAPLFVALPSAANNWNDALQSASPALRAGHPTLSSLRDRLNFVRSVPSIGSRE